MTEKGSEKAPGAFSLLGTASTMGLHMVSGPVVGGGLGWLIDHWLDSWPIAASIGLVLGLVAGFRNVWADARYLERSNSVLDEEKKRREEQLAGEGLKAGKSFEKAAEQGKKFAKTQFVPVVHKADEREKHAPTEEFERHSDSGSDSFTASILAGTALPQEQGLEELDETVEAIRRVLEGESPAKPAGTDPEVSMKGKE